MRLKKYLSEASKVTREEAINLILTNCKQWCNLINVKSEKDFNGNITKFYRGDDRHNNNFTKHDVRKRESTGTHGKYFPIINKGLKSKGHVPRDFCVLATSNSFHASGFANSGGLIFPIGNFKYTFIRAQDFNDMEYDQNGWDGFALVGLLKEQLMKVSGHPTISADCGVTEDEQDEIYDEQLLRFIKDYKGKDAKGYPLSIEVQSLTQGGGLKGRSVEAGNKAAAYVDQYFETNNDLTEAEINGYEIGFDCKNYYMVNENFLLG